MDNVTHSLIGLAAGEAVAVYTKKARVPLWIASALANNLPDLDVLLTATIFRGDFGYVLHHRGHTHTLLLAPALSALLGAGLCGVWRKRSDLPWREIWVLLFLGPFLHLLADYWNSYGVHPFWPWNSSWVYGDMVFIVEPWIWILLLPPIFFACDTKWGKGSCLGLLTAILSLAWFHPLVHFTAALALSLGAATLYFLDRKISGRGARISFSLFLVCIFLGGSAAVSASLKKRFAEPDTELLVQPFPANPFCWTSLRAHLGPQTYEAEIAVVAPFPRWVSAPQCGHGRFTPGLAPLELGDPSPSADRVRLARFRAPSAELDRLRADCRANAALRFIRIPYWKREADRLLLGDLRFDRSEARGLAQFYLKDADTECPRHVPPWRAPFHAEN